MVNPKGKQFEKENDEDDLDQDVDSNQSPRLNPKDINIITESQSLSNLISRIKVNAIDLKTPFQRRSELWTPKKMSRLIESIIVKFPLPAFYFDATDDENWLVVDGLQRLSTLRKFIVYASERKSEALKLRGLEYLSKDYEVTYDKLPFNIQRRINETQIVTHLIKPGTPKKVKYDLFYRLNTGGLVLNPQEIRHALNENVSSKATNLLESLCMENELFKKIVNVQDQRMQDHEVILRFAAFYFKSFEIYKPTMKDFLDDSMELLNEMREDELTDLKKIFNTSLEVCFELLGEHVFSKSIVDGRYANKTNRCLFEIWTVSISKLSGKQINSLINKKENLLIGFKNLLKDRIFDKSISTTTTSTEAVRTRFSMLNNLLKANL